MTYAYRPNAVIEIAGQSLTAAQAGLQSLTVDLGLGRHGRADMTLWPGSKFAAASEGDTLRIDLGPDGDETRVMTGKISARRQQTDRVVLEALDTSGALSRARSSITFEDSTISDIVTRIADESGITAQADGSDTLSIYYVVAHRPLWDHLRDLARLTGSDLSVDPDGQLLFQPGGTGDTHTLRHGAELMAWRVVAGDAPVAARFAAHGTASESGNWHWIGTDPLGEDPGLARVIGAFADRSLADAATDARAVQSARAALGGQVMITGNAGIRAGDHAVLTGLPGGDPDPLRVCGVAHCLDGDSGFTTTLQVEGGGTGGGLLGGLI